MKANRKFIKRDLEFWANVKLISQHVGYTDRKNNLIKSPNIYEIIKSYQKLGLSTSKVITQSGNPTNFATDVLSYFQYRANILNNEIRVNLLNKDSAKKEFEKLRKKHNPTCPLPLNKQKGTKRAYAYFTCMINILIEANLNGRKCDFDPGVLTTFTKRKHPYVVLSRRVDGAFPSPINPKVVWEIKEYYYTTTFGSRVADGIYESLLDGYELTDVHAYLNKKVKHYLFVDDYRTWWELGGKSYLCRIIDMLNMGYITEAIFGKEIFTTIPRIVKSW